MGLKVPLFRRGSSLRQALAAFTSKFDALGLGGLGLPSIPVSSLSTSTKTNSRRPEHNLCQEAKELSCSWPTGTPQDH